MQSPWVYHGTDRCVGHLEHALVRVRPHVSVQHCQACTASERSLGVLDDVIADAGTCMHAVTSLLSPNSSAIAAAS